MRFGILKKFLTAFLVISLVPLTALSAYTWLSMDKAGETVVGSSRESLIQNTMSLLEARARAIAGHVEFFLEGCADDLNLIATLPAEKQIYLNFTGVQKRKTWTRSLDAETSLEIIKTIPLYRELTFTDPDGFLRIHILDGKSQNQGQNISHPFFSSFGPENYFQEAIKLHPEKIYVSRLVGEHVPKPAGSQAPQVEYRGIIRFAKPVYINGYLRGVVSLALDHRHLMEYTQHVMPFGNREVAAPNYFSGNYAFIFDDQGWMVTHPKPWDIRGFDPSSKKLISPGSEDYNEENLKAGEIPFNLLHVPFIHTNYQHIAREVLAGRSGVTQTSSVGDVKRVLAFAPIKFNRGEYNKSGFFGGVTLGAQTDIFHSAVNETSREMNILISKTVNDSIMIIILAGYIVAGIAYYLARSFTRPILMLTEKAQDITRGDYNIDVLIRSGDELETLGDRFREMGDRIEKNERHLKQSFKDLKKSRDQIESIFSNITSGLVVFGPQGTVIWANALAEKFFNLPSCKILGRSIKEMLVPFQELRLLLERFGREGEVQEQDVKIIIPEGRHLHLEVSISSIQGSISPAGNTHMLMFRDITQRKNMEKHINRSDRLISIGILAAGIAHEIRNPLTGISLLLDDLHDRMGSRNQEREMMQQALEEIEKLERLITGLLEFSAKPETKFQKNDLNRLIEDSLFLVKKQCGKQKVSLTTSLFQGLPEIHIDPERIRQALLNILLNALKVLKDGGEIHISTNLIFNPDIFIDCSAVELSITDTGPGIKQEDMNFIFDPFFTNNPDGFGLGLSITHSIINDHDGKIIVENPPGKGAGFRIYLPISARKDKTEKPVQRAISADIPQTGPQGKLAASTNHDVSESHGELKAIVDKEKGERI